jgi:hypothetical protein
LPNPCASPDGDTRNDQSRAEQSTAEQRRLSGFCPVPGNLPPLSSCLDLLSVSRLPISTGPGLPYDGMNWALSTGASKKKEVARTCTALQPRTQDASNLSTWQSHSPPDGPVFLSGCRSVSEIDKQDIGATGKSSAAGRVCGWIFPRRPLSLSLSLPRVLGLLSLSLFPSVRVTRLLLSVFARFGFLVSPYFFFLFYLSFPPPPRPIGSSEREDGLAS